MESKDRQALNQLNSASNGQHGGRKRQRDDDNPRDAARRNRPLSGPWGGVGQTDLRDRRQSNGKSTSTRSSGNLVIQSWGKQNTHGKSLAHEVFNPNAPSTSVQTSHHSSPARLTQFSGLSPEIEDAMSGSLSLAQVLGDAQVPNSPEPPKEGVPGRASPRGRSRSSSDPINLISPTAKPSSHDAAVPISVEDDDSDSIVEEPPPPRSKPAPTTPKKQTPLREGHVREARAKFDTHKSQNQLTLVPYLTQVQESQPGSSSRAFATKTGPTSKGNHIVPGLTRQSGPPPSTQLSYDVRPQIPQAAQQGRASNRMGTKTKDPANSARQSGLVVATVGDGVRTSHSQPSARPKEPSHKHQRPELKLPVQDWYCGSMHHTAGRKGKDPYSLRFDGKSLSLARQGGALHMLKHDLRGFEVAESSDAEKTSELVPAVVFLLEDQFLSGRPWKDCSGNDDDPRLLVYFDAQPEDFAACWQELINRMAGWIQKHIVKIDAMNHMVKYMRDRTSSAKTTKQQTGSTFVVPAVQDDEHPHDQRILPVESKARASSPSIKPRTRSAASTLNDEAHEPEPSIIHNPDEVMLVYPQSGTGAVTINRGELARLEPGEFLNDSLIELGLKIWLNNLRERDPNLVDQIHVFSSFFFKKLDGGRGKGCEYDKVKKWTAKFDLFSKKFIVIPINEHLHWYLAIICFPEFVLKAPPTHLSTQPTRVTRSSDAAAAAQAQERRASLESDIPNVDQSSTIDVEAGSPTEPGRMEIDNELADQSQKMAIDSTTPPEIPSDAMIVDANPNDNGSESEVLDMTNDTGEDQAAPQPIVDEKSQKTWILILDSLGGKHPRTIRLLREYLQAEALERHKAVVEIKDAKSSGGFVEDKHLAVPVQPNWCDCGVYLLHYVEAFYSNPLKILALPPGARRRGHANFSQYEELWQTAQVKKNREAFRVKVLALSSAWLESKRSTPKRDTSVPAQATSHATHALPPLANLEGDSSLLIIDPSIPDTVPNTPSSLSSRPPRTGILPPGPGESSEGEVEIMTVGHSAIEESIASRSTRRGKKAGSKHGGSGQSSEGTQGSVDL